MTPNSARLSPVLAYNPDRHLFVGRDQSLGWGWCCTPRPGGSEREEQQLRVILEDEWPPGSHLQFLLYASPKYLNEQLLDLGTSLRVDSRGIDLEGGGRLVLCSPKSFAEAAFFGMAQYLVSDVFLGRRGLFAPFFLSLTVFYPEQQALRSRLAMKRAWTVNSAHSPLVKWLPGLETRHRDFNVLTESMDNGHRPVRFALTLGVYGRDASTAEAAVTDAVNFWAEQSVVLLPDRFVAAPLLINALPLGADRRAIIELGRYHTMTTEQTACFAPVFGPWRGTGMPVVTPVSRDGQLMSFDLYDSQTNANAVIAAESGAGKSFLAQLMTASYLAAGATVWTIDIGGSYRNLCERLGGEYIDFADREISLNPFRLVTDWEEESDIVEALIGSMAAATEKLTDLQRSVLGRTLRGVWAAFGPETSIDAIVDRLKNEPDQRIQDLGDQLYPFTAAGPYGRFFRGENTVSFRNR